MTNSGYQLRRILEPPIEPVSRTEAKLWCKVDADITEDDELIDELIAAARELAEDYCKRTFIDTTWEWTFSCFPVGLWYPTALEIPMGPVIELLEMSYLDTAGVRQAVNLATFTKSLKAEPPTLMPPFGQLWPANQIQNDSVVLTYRAGYDSGGSPADATAVPKKAKTAIKEMVAHWYKNRTNVVTETRQIPTVIPFGFERLLDSLKVYP